MSGPEAFAAVGVWLRAARRHRWTAAEEDLLRRGHETGEPWEDIAVAVGLPVASCLYRAKLLGLGRKQARRCEAAQ